MLRKFGAIAWLLLVLSGCNSDDPGSGGGIGGSGVTPIKASGATLGSISGFGSVIVNGEQFNSDNATFLMNEKPVTQGDLRVGMNILAAVNFSSNVASQIEYVPSLIGPVESVDLENKTFQSLGQTVQLGGGTRFENLSLQEVATGMVVEVSGLRNATGIIFATFIRPAIDVTRLQLSGAVLSNLGDGQLFSLNGLQVNIAQADRSKISASELEFGDKVYITADAAAYDPVERLVTADSVRVALEPMVTAGEQVQYEGIVSTFMSPFEFSVYWQPVTTTDQTRVEFQDGSLAELSMIMLNTRVEIEGVVQADGSYLASKVILIATENSKVSGVIERIIPETTSFSVLGLDIQTTVTTRFDGSSDDGANQDVSSFAGLAVGQYVEVDAALLGNRFIANRVKVDDLDARAILEGPVTALGMTPENVGILGKSILLGEQTSYENGDDVEISKQAFIDLLRIGVIVKARWDEFQSVTLPPDSMEIE